MAMYRIKKFEDAEPASIYPEAEYWRETRPGQERDLDFEEIADLNAASEGVEEEELEPIRSFRSRVLTAGIAAVLILAFAVWIGYSLFPQRFDFSHLIRSAQLSQDESLSALQKAVVVIESTAGSGTGFNISPDGMIVTNAHVVKDGGILTISFSREAGGQVFSTREYKRIEGVDLALIPIEGEDLPAVALAEQPIESLDPREENLIFIGSPLGYDWTISEGQLWGIVPMDGSAAIYFHGPVHPGSSGSPLFNEQAQVIGVVYAMLGREEDQQGLAVPISYLIEAMEEMKSE